VLHSRASNTLRVPGVHGEHTLEQVLPLRDCGSWSTHTRAEEMSKKAGTTEKNDAKQGAAERISYILT